MAGTDAQRYWDERAREDALYFVDNRVAYRNPDEEAFWAGGDEALDTIADLLGLEFGAEQHVVDIGCGVGRMTRALAKRVRRVTGIDISSEMLDRAKRFNAHLENVEWIHGDGQSLQPIADASADGCFSHVVFQHVPDQEITFGYIREMGRILRPGGWAAFQVSSDPAVHRQRPPLAHRLRALVGRAPRGGTHPAWLGSYVDIDAMRATCAGAGLEVERIEGEGTQFTMVRLRRSAG